MEVQVWSSDWGLPSIEPRCLQLITYAKFSGAPLHVLESNNPFWTPRGDLPVFSHSATVKSITEFGPFVAHLRSCKFSADYNLEQKQLSEVSALCQLIDEKLYPAVLYSFWIDAKNHVELVRPWFTRKIPFPLNLYYPNQFHNRAAQVIESRFGCQADDPTLESALYRSAKETMDLLSRRLGSEQYLFGKSPSSADAVLYAHLAPLLKAPLPSASLQNHLKGCTNLVAFVGRVTQNYFAQISMEYERKQKQFQTTSSESAETTPAPPTAMTPARFVSTITSKEFLNRFASCLVAGVAMMAYAHFSGLLHAVRNIEISIEEDEDGEED